MVEREDHVECNVEPSCPTRLLGAASVLSRRPTLRKPMHVPNIIHTRIRDHDETADEYGRCSRCLRARVRAYEARGLLRGGLPLFLGEWVGRKPAPPWGTTPGRSQAAIVFLPS